MSDSGRGYECPRCHTEVDATDDFCPNCGELFAEGPVCYNHQDREAGGVCIICCLPFCTNCARMVQGRFLCDKHKSYEIYQGMARVFGDSDATQVEFAKSCLENAGLHPFVYSRKASPISLGGPEYTLFRASGDYNGHIVNEFKLMVPCQEVVAAEAALRELQMIT
jgi:RNA polymerase subunit RPABC4/transcription elongation factor Spt4